MWSLSLFKSILLLIPTPLRKTRFLAWLKVSLSYLHMLAESLKIYRYFLHREITTTPQVIYIERLLNTRFGRSDIFISEGYGLGPWIWNISPESGEFDFYFDQQDSFVFNSNDAETISFIVNIPSILHIYAKNIGAIVQKHKLPGKSFIIQIFYS